MATLQIGDTVTFSREGYSFTNGVVLTTDDIRRGAVVQWGAVDGTHVAFCGAEFLTVTDGVQSKTPQGAIQSVS